MKLLKSMLLSVAALCSAAAVAEADIGVWTDVPAGIENKSITGARFGLPCSISNGSVNGGEFSIVYSGTRYMEGIKFTLLGVNNAEKLNGGALALVNLTQQLNGAQVGLVNQSAKGGVQFGLINNCNDNAQFQCGLININKNGWLPFMIFVNFGSAVFE